MLPIANPVPVPNSYVGLVCIMLMQALALHISSISSCSYSPIIELSARAHYTTPPQHLQKKLSSFHPDCIRCLQNARENVYISPSLAPQKCVGMRASASGKAAFLRYYAFTLSFNGSNKSSSCCSERVVCFNSCFMMNIPSPRPD